MENMESDKNFSKRKVVIVGSGFAGIRCALDLVKSQNFKVTLISNKSHFEYYPRIYRVVTGETPLEVCIPLSEIFTGKNIDVNIDEITGVDLQNKKVIGKNGTIYEYDYLILALGSETVYFDIEGVAERSFGFKSINEALKLKDHLHKIFDIYLSSKKEDVIAKLNIVVVGGGPSGVELVGELTKYMSQLSSQHGIDNNFITIDLIEASSRLVPTLPEKVSNHIYNRLHSLGVNIFLNRTVVREDVNEIIMKDMSMKSNTLIWTAGSKTNRFYNSIAGLTFSRNAKVIVDEYLQAKGFLDVYIAGDASNTKYSGLAQTAIYDGSYIASVIIAKNYNKIPSKYIPKKVAYAVPIGKHWAAVSVGPFRIYGFMGWLIREFVDLRFFMSILPFGKAWSIYRNQAICESCETCAEGPKANLSDKDFYPD